MSLPVVSLYEHLISLLVFLHEYLMSLPVVLMQEHLVSFPDLFWYEHLVSFPLG